MENIAVLITGTGGGGVGEQVLKALKLSINKYVLIGTDTTLLCKNKYDVDFFYKVPPANDPEYINCLLGISEKHRCKAIIPGSEPELKIISEYRSEFRKKNTIPFINPASVIDICLDKFKTMRFLGHNGFAFPKSLRIVSEQDLLSVDFFPLVIKPSVGGGGSANTMIAQTKEELMLFGKYMLNIYPEFIVQEYVGTPEEEYTVGVLCDMKGALINSIVIRRNILTGLSNRIKIKNNSGNTAFGNLLVISSGISQGEIVENKPIADVCEKLAIQLGATGAINIQCRVYNNKVYVFEINPRFSGTTSLRAMVGYNEPDVLLRREILEENIPLKFKYRYAHITRGLSETLITDPFHD